jgi:hypothetical protein
MPRTIRRLIQAVFVVALFAASGGAQQLPADPAARRAEADFRLSFKDAVRTADTDPANGAEKLRGLLKQIEVDSSLPGDRRDQWTSLVRDRLRIAEAGPDPAAVAATAARQQQRDDEIARQAEQTAKLKGGLQEALKLDRQGKGAEAQARLDDLLRQFKDHAIVQAVTHAEEVRKWRAESNETRTLKDRGALATLNEVDRSAISPGADIVFPKDYKAKMAARKNADAPTAAKLKALQSLNANLPADFKNTGLQDAVEYISTMMNMPIVLDKGALDENKLTYTTPITFVVKRPVSARTALRGILNPLGLTYVVVDGVVFVTTPQRAREYLTVKVYNVIDLVQVSWEDANYTKRMLNAMFLIDTITSMVDPDSWEQRGGPGVIRYYDPVRGLVVRQSAEVHISLKASLNK